MYVDYRFHDYRLWDSWYPIALVGTASSILYWQYKKYTGQTAVGLYKGFLLLQFLLLATVIVLSIGAEVAGHLGYKWRARALLLGSDATIWKSIEWSIAEQRFQLSGTLLSRATKTLCFELALLLAQALVQLLMNI